MTLADARGGPLGAAPRVWAVASLVHAVADALTARFGAVAVEGEVCGFSRASSGHCYFTLRDPDGSAALRCAMFRRAAGLLDFAPAEGDRVEVRGRIAVYEPRGELQFVVESMRRAGAGALYERFLRLRAQLEAEGLFAPERKRPIAPYPRTVGVVTSLGAAALHDVLTALRRRAPHVRVVVYPSPVQGSEAPAALAAALALAGRRAEADTLVVARGGGSLEDLWAFNEAVVVRAIAASPIPVVVGVGHETDVTLADLAADLRAPTPTAAAELAAVPRADALAVLLAHAQRLRRALRQRFDRDAQRLDRATLRLARPAQAVALQRERLARLVHRQRTATQRRLEHEARTVARLAEAMAPAARSRLGRDAQRLAVLSARLQALDPTQVLARGYAWLSGDDGRPVASVRALHAGDAVQARLADGVVHARVSRLEGPGD